MASALMRLSGSSSTLARLKSTCPGTSDSLEGTLLGQVQGKVAIVTGGASGIGAACATTLAREGAKVVVTDLEDAVGKAVVDEIGGARGEAIFLHQDVSLEESWPSMIEAAERRFGRLDVMVA